MLQGVTLTCAEQDQRIGEFMNYLITALLLSASTAFAQVPTIRVGTITGARDSEMQMIVDGITLANKILATDCYRQFILNAHFTETNDLTQTEIYDLMKNTPVVVDIEMYRGGFKANHLDKTVGYETDPYDGVVHMNRYFVNTPEMVADNVIHEGEGHSLGFHHYGVKATSVPYGTNQAFEACLFTASPLPL